MCRWNGPSGRSVNAAGSTPPMWALRPNIRPSARVAPMRSKRRSMPDFRVKAYGLAALVFVLDRLTKWIIEARVSFTDTYRVIPGFFDIVNSQNRGVAFGILNDSTSEWRTM